MIKIYNTLTDTKEPIPRPKNRPVRLFVCGPTVYDYLHIGNGRTYMVFDLFARYLRSRSIKLFYLQNITDVDDKIIARANEQGASWSEIAKTYEKIYKANLKALNISSVTKYANATKYIPEIVKQVQTLEKKGHVYQIEDDGYYFDLSTFPSYGKLAGRTIAQAEDGVSRIDMSDRKRNMGDFCVWKFSKPNEPTWKTALGAGRPGWHIEDTAISEHFFGPQYDIHGAGIDLKFPHHEAEIAQQESASGKKPFVKLWMHVGALTVNGRKMSKSVGNFISIEDMLDKVPADAFRMMIFAHHYRSPMDFTESMLTQAGKNLYDLTSFTGRLEMAKGVNGKIKIDVQDYEKRFHAAMENDLNTPEALAALFALFAAIGGNIWQLESKSARAALLFVKKTLQDIGFLMKTPKTPPQVKKKAKERELFRKSKQFIQSDALRKEIEGLGYVVEDTSNGPFLWPKPTT
ncbi:MAG: cysteine--tRNA ligase [Patescibacteria group bacterium]